MAEGSTAVDLALETEGEPDGSALIEFGVGERMRFSATLDSSGALQYIDDHEERAARQLAPPFWGKPVIAAVLGAFSREVQFLEDAAWDAIDIRALPNADLPRLEVLGKIVGQPRLGFDADTYRELIGARALANVSRGRASDLIAVMELLVGPGDYEVLAIGNATLWVTVKVPVDAEGLRKLTLILPDTRAAGVGMQLLFSTAEFEDVFVWGDEWGAPEQWGSVRVL